MSKKTENLISIGIIIIFLCVVGWQLVDSGFGRPVRLSDVNSSPVSSSNMPDSSGIQYKKDDEKIICSGEIKICPNGTAVRRSGGNCEFELCQGYDESIFQTKIEEWRIYQSEKNGFEVKYPSGVPINYREEDDLLSIGWVPYEPASGAVFIDIRNENISQYRDFLKKNAETEPCTPEKEILLGENNFQSIICKEAFGGSDVNVYFIEHKGKIYTAEFILSENKEENELFTRIISTFKFINPNEENIDWQTYRSGMHGFEIKYPDDYAIFQGLAEGKQETVPVNSSSKTVFITNEPKMFFCCEPVYVSIEILDNYVIDFEKWLTDEKIINSENEYWIKNKSTIDFAGERAYYVESKCGIDSPKNIILLNHKHKTYYIRHDNEECFPFAKKIISSFKFIK